MLTLILRSIDSVSSAMVYAQRWASPLLNLRVSKTSWLCCSGNTQIPSATWTWCWCSRSVCWTWQRRGAASRSCARPPSPCTRSRRVCLWTRSASWARTGGKCPLHSFPCSWCFCSPIWEGGLSLLKVPSRCSGFRKALNYLVLLDSTAWAQAGGSAPLVSPSPCRLHWGRYWWYSDRTDFYLSAWCSKYTHLSACRNLALRSHLCIKNIPARALPVEGCCHGAGTCRAASGGGSQANAHLLPSVQAGGAAGVVHESGPAPGGIAASC